MRGRLLVVLLAIGVLGGACGDDDAASVSETTTAGTQGTQPGGVTTVPATTVPATTGGDARGSVTIGDETITFDSARCYLQEQEAAAGGGSILATAQGFGTNADGEEVVVDFSRYDEESDFVGDHVTATIGDPFSDEAINLAVTLDLGDVGIDGSTVGAGGFAFQNLDDLSEVAGSFEIRC
jgi:hypothetical protein